MEIYGSYQVLERAHQDDNGHTYWKVQCTTCQRIAFLVMSRLKKNPACPKCKPAARKYQPEHYRHPLFQTYQGMVQRCTNTNHKDWNNYGGRGIVVCDRWLQSFENFIEDVGERPNGCTLDRINRDGPYCKENCRWATASLQNKNKRTNYGSKLSKVFRV